MHHAHHALQKAQGLQQNAPHECATAVAFQVCVTHTAKYGQAPDFIKHLCDSRGVRLLAYMSRLATPRGTGCCSLRYMIACPASSRIAVDAIALQQNALCTVQHPLSSRVDIACFSCVGRFTAQRKSRAGGRNRRWRMGCQGGRPDNSHVGPATRALLQGPHRPPQAP